MRTQNGVQYSHTRLELRVFMQKDGRLGHLSIPELNEAITKHGIWKDIFECPAMLDRVFRRIFRDKYGYFYKEIYYKPWESMQKILGYNPPP